MKRTKAKLTSGYPKNRDPKLTKNIDEKNNLLIKTSLELKI